MVSGSRTRLSYIAHASAQRPSRSACFARSMLSLTEEDSTAFNSIVGLWLVMTPQQRSRRAPCRAGSRIRNLRPALVGRGNAYPGHPTGEDWAIARRDVLELGQDRWTGSGATAHPARIGTSRRPPGSCFSWAVTS